MEENSFNNCIFKAYDIRGVCDSEINEKVAYKIGQAFVYLTKSKKVVVGRDKRKSSPSLFKYLIKGITSMGCDVIDIGLSTTPLFYFSVGTLKVNGGVMITASHNPAEYNGFKLAKHLAIPFVSKDIQKIKKIIENKKFKQKNKKGKIYKKDVSKKYIKKILSYSKLSKKLKVVVDSGNGMGSLITPKVFCKLPLSTTYLYKKIDQTYPNHIANPLDINTLKDLQKKVIKKKADIGIAFDGDADRVGFVDEKGEIVPIDLITALLIKNILKEKPNSKIFYTLTSSWVIKEVIKENNGIPIEHRVGHSFIKRKMHKINAPFGGETSGHYFFSDFFYSEAPIFACILIFNLLEKNKLSELIKPFKRYFKTQEINFNIKNSNKIILKLKKKYYRGKITEIDGVKIEFKDWWFNLRLSHTESFLRLNLEGRTKDLMKKKLKEISKIIVN